MQMITPADTAQINRIVDRAMRLQKATHALVKMTGATVFSELDDRATLTALIAGCHLQACRLDLKKWADAPPIQFKRDFLLIRHNFDPMTGRLKSPMTPLCAADEPDADLFGPDAAPTHPGLADLAGGNDDEGGQQ